MVKVRVRGVNGQKKLIIARAKRLARIAMADPKLATKWKNLIIDPIRKDGILPSGSKVKALKVQTVKQRRKLSKLNKTSKYFKNFFSNMTFTGQFLKSFRVKVFKSKNIQYLIAPTGLHKPYKKTREQVNYRDDATITNAELGGYLIDGGRDYTVIGEKTKAKLIKAAIGRIRRELKLKLNL